MNEGTGMEGPPDCASHLPPGWLWMYRVVPTQITDSSFTTDSIRSVATNAYCDRMVASPELSESSCLYESSSCMRCWTSSSKAVPSGAGSFGRSKVWVPPAEPTAATAIRSPPVRLASDDLQLGPHSRMGRVRAPIEILIGMSCALPWMGRT